MPDNRFYRPAPSNPGIWGNFWLPFLASVVLSLIDFYLIPGIFALPLLLLILLIFLAFRLPARTVAAWTAAFGVVVLTIRLMPLSQVATLPALKPYILTAFFLTGGAGSILLAAYRRRLEMGHEALFQIIAGLPLAVIVSDISGRILLLNDQAQQVLKNHLGDPAGLSFFSTFVRSDDEGRTIAAYLNYFDPPHLGTVTTALRTRGAPALILHAAITVVAIGNHRYAITVVERVEPVGAAG
jgi:PAS domain-containing protein